MSPTTFARLGVPAHVCRALEQRGITEPFDIQAATIADALAGRDVCGRAPTGSGKTLAFGLPLVATVERAAPRLPRGLVLVPTRELAEQISSELTALDRDVRVLAVYGGVGYGPQNRALARGVEIVVACPGRLEDLLSQGALRLSAVDRVVLDEADQMADMGFLPVVRRLLDATSPDRQTVLFSATLDHEVAALTRTYQRDPVHHQVGGDDEDGSAAEHRFYLTDREQRVELGARLIERAWPAVVFCRTRHGADRVARQLSRHGVDAVAIHGGHSQNKRTRSLDRFTAGRVQALVATDVAARGIHVDGVAAVLHFDIPADAKTYVHRSGRTARAGSDGLVVSLVLPNQKGEARRMQREVDLDLPIEPADLDDLPTMVPTRQPSPAPAGDAPAPTGRRSSGGAASRAAGGRSRSRGRADGRPDRGGASGDGRRRRRRGSGQERRDGGELGPRPTGAGSGSGATGTGRNENGGDGRRTDGRGEARGKGGRGAGRAGSGEKSPAPAGGRGRSASSAPAKGAGEKRSSKRSARPRPADKQAGRSARSRGKAASRTARNRAPRA